MNVENIITLFENEAISSVPEPKEIYFHFKHIDFSGPLVCIKKNELNDANISFLAKIVKAIGFEFSSECNVAIFDNDQKYAFSEVIKTPSSCNTILFGSFEDQFDLNLHIKQNEWTVLGNFSVLFSYSLDDLQKDQIKKQELWKALKTKYG